jgi:hypothetical protein
VPLRRFEDCASSFCTLRRLNGIALSKIYEITRPDFVALISPRRAFLQFLHPNPIQSPLAGFCGTPFCGMVSRFFAEDNYRKISCSCLNTIFTKGIVFMKKLL